jgi:hypothetical protein
MTSGGKQNPAKAEWAMGAGRRRRGRIATVCLLKADHSSRNSPRLRGVVWGEAEEGTCPADVEAALAVQAQVRAETGWTPWAARLVAKLAR